MRIWPLSSARLRDRSSAFQGLRSRLLLLLLLRAAFPGLAVGSDCAFPTVSPGGVVWQGTPHGLDRRQSGSVVELAPDGRSFLYFQGLPWPRLMLQSFADGATPVMMSTLAPFGARSPRFSPTGEFVYFTAELDWRPRRRPRKGEANPGDDLRAAVVRIASGDRTEKILAPSPGSARNAFAIFLDLDPSGNTILIGTGNGLRVFGSTLSPYKMEVFELDVAGKKPRKKLPFVVKEAAVARYSNDGRTIYYTNYARGEGPAVVYGYHRETGVESKLFWDVQRGGWGAGDLDIGAVTLPHLGSFGFDAFPSFFLRHGNFDASLQWKASPGLPPGDGRGSWPISVREDRVLLRVGPPDQALFVLATWDATAYEDARTLATEHPECLSDSRLPKVRERVASDRAVSRRRAQASSEAEEILSLLSRSLILPSDAPLRAARVSWKEDRVNSGVPREFHVLETSRGSFRLEKITPPFDPLDAPMKEVWVSDGRNFQTIDDRGDVRTVPERIFQAERNGVSPFQLLFDPIGLTHVGLEFVSVASAKKDSERRLDFVYVDGYRGSLFVELEGDGARPTRIVSPLLFASEHVRKSLGKPLGGEERKTKTVSFADFRTIAGRLLPHRITFESGFNDYTLTLEEVDFNPEIPDDSFECQ